MEIAHTKKTAIGVDIGGTKIRCGIVDRCGQVVGAPESIPTLADEPGDRIIERLVRLIRRTAEQAGGTELAGIGIGSTGPLDIDKGVILECNNLPTLHNYPLRQAIESAFGLPVRVNNDANAMIFGEALWGAGKGFDSILGVTLGTGLGAAIVKDGSIVRGASGCAGEIWLSPYKDGMIEDYVSGPALSRLYRETEGKEASGEEVGRLARQGDARALKAWEEFAQALAYALAWCVNLLDPEAVVVGGSVMRSADLFWESMLSLLKKRLCPPTAANIRVKPANLKDDAGLMGAAALMFVE